MTPRSSRKYRIMSVDNEPYTANLVKEVLEAKGYKVSTALSGTECLKKLNKENFDLVLLDIMMPGLSGWDVYERIRKKHKNLKVAFLSIMECSPARRAELKKKGVSDYINKPFTPEELSKRVGTILGKNAP